MLWRSCSCPIPREETFLELWEASLKCWQSTILHPRLCGIQDFLQMPEDSQSSLAKKRVVLVWHLVLQIGLWNQPSWMQQLCFSSLWEKVSLVSKAQAFLMSIGMVCGRTYGIQGISPLKTTFCWNLWPSLWLGTELLVPLQGIVSMSITVRCWNCWHLMLTLQWTFPN